MYCTNIFGGSNYKDLNNKTQAEMLHTVYGDRSMLNIWKKSFSRYQTKLYMYTHTRSYVHPKLGPCSYRGGTYACAYIIRNKRHGGRQMSSLLFGLFLCSKFLSGVAVTICPGRHYLFWPSLFVLAVTIC